MHGGTRVLMAVAALGAVTTMAACSVTSDSKSKVSVAKIRQAADKLIDDPKGPCPLGIDVTKALAKAGIGGTATPRADAETPAAEGESAKSAESPDSILQQLNGALVTCDYTLSSGGHVSTMLMGVGKGKAVNVLAPMISHDGQIGTEAFQTFASQKFESGKAALTPNLGLVAVVELSAKDGDVALEVTSHNADDQSKNGPITGEALRKFAEALAGQVSL